MDEFSAQAALSSGEIDWWELPSRDSADLVARDRNVTLISHYMPAMGILRFNQLYPPFDKPEARRALLKVVDQAETMTAVAGADPANWLDGIGLFSHGTPLANDAGIEILRRPHYLLLVAVEEAFKNLKGDLAIRPVFHQLEARVEAHVFIAFLAYCLHVTLARRLHALAPGLTTRSVLEKFAAVQMIDVHLPTTDDRELVLTRYTEPEPELSLLLNKLKLDLPAQPHPKITAAPPPPSPL